MSDIAIPQEVWDHQLTASAPTKAAWLWQGFIAPANTTLFTSHGKLGKTTLLSMLLSRRKQGGTLAGLAVKPGRTVVISEESREVWEEHARQFDFGGKVCFVFRPFLTIPTPEEWRALIERILALRDQHDIDLAVLDPLGPFLRGENQARSIYDALLPLGALTRRGMAVTMAPPSRQGRPAHRPGAAAPRPCSPTSTSPSKCVTPAAIPSRAAAPGCPVSPCRNAAPAPPGTQCPVHRIPDLADGPIDDYLANWDHLRGVLEDAPQKLTRHDILDEWPADFDKPGITALRNWLDRALALGAIVCAGSGRKKDPFRYWLPEREAVWKQAPLYDLLEEKRRKLKLPFESLRERRQKLGDEYGGCDSPLPAPGFPDENDAGDA